jgi:hypothetical protein
MGIFQGFDIQSKSPHLTDQLAQQSLGGRRVH